MQTIFERYGGFANVSRIVSDFYDKVLESERLAPYFDGVDTKRLIDHQTKFIASVMGGPASYTNDQLERVHRHLKIDGADFDEIIELLKESLEDFDLERNDIDIVIHDVASRRRYIVFE